MSHSPSPHPPPQILALTGAGSRKQMKIHQVLSASFQSEFCTLFGKINKMYVTPYVDSPMVLFIPLSVYSSFQDSYCPAAGGL